MAAKKKLVAKKKPAAKKSMTIEDFWSVVAAAANAADRGRDQIAVLRSELGKLDAEQLVAFQGHFDDLHGRAYRWDIWGAAYLIEGGCSDDGFTDFRYSLIMKGRGVYERALKSADSLAGADIVADESLGYLALEVYEEKTGRAMPRKDWSQPANPLGKAWDFDDDAENLRHLPRVTRAAR